MNEIDVRNAMVAIDRINDMENEKMVNMDAMDAIDAIDAVATKDAIEAMVEMNGWTE